AASAASAAGIAGLCEREELPFLAIGNGSNLLVSDAGVKGVILRLAGDPSGIALQGTELICSAGVQLSAACGAAHDGSLTGLEFAYGIPGTVGGAVFMNAGAYGGEMKDIVVRAEHIGRQSAGAFEGPDLCFGYRRSAYTGSGLIITKVRFRLRRGDAGAIESRMRLLLQRRREKQPLDYPSAGSVFKRPEGRYAGALIEGCGLKGASEGAAMVSEKHAGFIINTGGATCADVRKLIERIQNEVLRQTGVALECEIRIL
ncbi:MAG: UDP-N-acetylmuramate dehydrogenase, partial [Clostridia bacterium]|nr:UDP-N-acetylmuramate dehydrogenase [Clostridia bacterium]